MNSANLDLFLSVLSLNKLCFLCLHVALKSFIAIVKDQEKPKTQKYLGIPKPGNNMTFSFKYCSNKVRILK